MLDRQTDARVRTATFDWLASQVAGIGEVLPRNLLEEGFSFGSTRVPLIGPQGIFKPRILDVAPLSITTIPGGPYDDSVGPDELLRYRYRGTDPAHRDNVGLRLAMSERLPLVHFFRIVPGKYMASWPVYVVGDDPRSLTFSVAVDDAKHLAVRAGPPTAVEENADAGRRRYVTAVVFQRRHQLAFRERVLEAYRRQCAFCRLRHEELLDAAHIVADSDPRGEPVVQNGLALCKLHHAAFDGHFLGLRPNLVIEVRPDVLRESDGPTLIHSIQALHGRALEVPRRADARPGAEFLELRYAAFQRAAAAAG